MPNWCEVDLTVSVEQSKDEEGYKEAEEQLKKFQLEMKGHEFDFDKILPTPSKMLTGKAAKGASPDWYNWRLENWGVKWSPSDVTFGEIDNYDNMEIGFRSPWAPPSKMILHLSSQYPLLRFDMRYFEGGMQFNGFFRARKGGIVEDKVGDYYGDRGG